MVLIITRRRVRVKKFMRRRLRKRWRQSLPGQPVGQLDLGLVYGEFVWIISCKCWSACGCFPGSASSRPVAGNFQVQYRSAARRTIFVLHDRL